MLNLKKLLTKIASATVQVVVTPSISLTGSSWGGHYYQDINVASYVPSGMQIIGAFVGPGTSGSVLNASVQDRTNNIVRVLNDASMSGRSVNLVLLVQRVGGGTA